MPVVDTLVVSLFQSNCFIVRLPDAGTALVVDPGDNAGEIVAHLEHHRCSVAAYLLTHGHVDHVTALADVVDAFPAPVAMHPLDAQWAFSDRAAFPPYYGPPRAPPRIDRELADGQQWTDMGLTYEVIGLPGHSPGGVGFYFPSEAMLFSGDTLFRGSIGRTDLPGANARQLAESLSRLTLLPDETVVYCGHGPETSIGHERQDNPFLQSFEWASLT